MTPQGRNEIRRLLETHGLRPRKAYGQHFLADPNLVDRIVRLADVGPGSRVVEIGAGTGTLTRALAETGADVIAYEIDERLRPILEEELSSVAVEVRVRDATELDLCAELMGTGWTMVANLPYNVGTPLLLDSLRHAMCIERFVVMVQREVADRLVAPAGTKAFGLPSVVARLHATVAIEFGVRPHVFVPQPDVDSAVVVLERRGAPHSAERAIELAAAAFGQRRKMLRRSLAAVLEDPASVLERAGIDPTRRAEDLDPIDWVSLAAAEGTP